MNSKFRVWYKNEKRWEQNECFVHSSGTANYVLLNGVMVTVSPDSHIVQFSSGLTDKNGKEIFAGDICGYDNDPSRLEVVVEGCAFRKKYPEWDSRDEKPIISQFDIDNLGMHVIGNIFEHPTLLKGKHAD